MPFDPGDQARAFWPGSGGKEGWRKGWYPVEIVSYNSDAKRFPYIVKWSDDSRSKRTAQQVVAPERTTDTVEAPMVIPDRQSRAHQFKNVSGLYCVSCQPLIDDFGVVKVGYSHSAGGGLARRLADYELAYPVWPMTLFCVVTLPPSLSRMAVEIEEKAIHKFLRTPGNGHVFSGRYRLDSNSEWYEIRDLELIKEKFRVLADKYKNLGGRFWGNPSAVTAADIPTDRDTSEMERIECERVSPKHGCQLSVVWKGGQKSWVSKTYFLDHPDIHAYQLYMAKKSGGMPSYMALKDKLDIAKEKKRGYEREMLAAIEEQKEKRAANAIKRSASQAMRAVVREKAFELAREAGVSSPTPEMWKKARG